MNTRFPALLTAALFAVFPAAFAYPGDGVNLVCKTADGALAIDFNTFLMSTFFRIIRRARGGF